jgi:hypothetical protein
VLGRARRARGADTAGCGACGLGRGRARGVQIGAGVHGSRTEADAGVQRFEGHPDARHGSDVRVLD